MGRGWFGPSDDDLNDMLAENGYSRRDIDNGHHSANDDMQSQGWLTQRAINKWVQKYPEDGEGEWVEVEEDYSRSNWCFIATATLQGDYQESILLPLKNWRYKVMEKTSLGRKLSDNYRKNAPEIAKQISDMPRASAFLRKVFVFPAIKLSKKTGYPYDILLWMIYFTGSFTARAIVFFGKNIKN
jgi:hypothetical protein